VAGHGESHSKDERGCGLSAGIYPEQTRYPDQTRFAFRSGVTYLTTPAGAVLLNPPRSEKLNRLTAGQLQALKTLNQGPTTVAEISRISKTAPGSEIGALINQLAARGWLTVTVRDDGQDLYTILPFGQPPPRPAPFSRSAVLSKFAVLHRDSEGFVVEHPLAWCDLRIHDSRLLILLDGPDDADLTTAVAAQFVADLRWCGMFVPAGEEDGGFETLSWSAPDLWFHRRSTLGERTVTWETSVRPSGPKADFRNRPRAGRTILVSRSPCPFPT
jgi:hypothetical protein